MPKLNSADQVATYCQDSVYPVAAAEDDDKLMKQFGRRVSDGVLESDTLEHENRPAAIGEICSNEFT